MVRFYSSSIGRKFMMALTGFFLIIFLLVHLGANLTLFAGHTGKDGSILPKEEILFNQACHFMATNPIIQIMQFVLAFGFIYHIILGITVTIKNRKARGNDRYVFPNAVNIPTASKSMIISGIIILLFLILHLYDYFYKMQFTNMEGYQYGDYQLVTRLLTDPIHLILYLISFIALGLHLSHGINSAFQSVGFSHRIYNSWVKTIGIIYVLIVSIGFIAIALYFFLKPVNL